MSGSPTRHPHHQSVSSGGSSLAGVYPIAIPLATDLYVPNDNIRYDQPSKLTR